MTPAEGAEGSADRAVRAALAALDDALLAPDAMLVPAVETRLQTAIDLLRKEGGRSELAAQLGELAAAVRLIAEAKRTGQLNLYASKLARLRRSRAAAAGVPAPPPVAT